MQGANRNDDDINPILESSQSSIVSSVSFPPEDEKIRWRSIRIIYLTTFISSVSFSICMSSLWPYLRLMNPKATTTFLGWVVGAYSVGQFIASPIFGSAAKYFHNSRYPLVVALCINICGCLIYCYVEDLPTPESRSWALLASRAMIGFGSGTIGIVRAYVAQSTTLAERTGTLTILSSCQALGFILGPGLQAACVVFRSPGILETPYLHLNTYTSAGFLSILFGLLNIGLLCFSFREYSVSDSLLTVNDTSYGAINDNSMNSISSRESLKDRLPPLDHCTAVSLIFIFFSVLLVFSLSETILTPLVMDEYAWTKHDATLYVGIMLAAGGVLSVGVLLGVRSLAFRIDERIIYMFGFILCGLTFIIWYPFGNTYPPVKPSDVTPANATWTPRPDDDENDNTVGCDLQEKPWCATVPQIHPAQFYTGLVLTLTGYPITNVLTNTFFSKVLGDMHQGVWMGWLSASGSLARFTGPLLVGFLYGTFGPHIIVLSMGGLVLITVLWVLGIYRRIVPRGEAPRWRRNMTY